MDFLTEEEKILYGEAKQNYIKWRENSKEMFALMQEEYSKSPQKYDVVESGGFGAIVAEAENAVAPQDVWNLGDKFFKINTFKHKHDEEIRSDRVVFFLDLWLLCSNAYPNSSEFFLLCLNRSKEPSDWGGVQLLKQLSDGFCARYYEYIPAKYYAANFPVSGYFNVQVVSHPVFYETVEMARSIAAKIRRYEEVRPYN